MKLYQIAISLLLFTACSSKKSDEKKEADTKAAMPSYKLVAVLKTGVSSTIKLPAQLAAYESVSIFPKANGYVKNVLVDIGSKVSRGQLLMTLEAPEMQQSVLQAKEKYLQTQSAFALSKERYERLQVAAKTPGAISPYDLSSARTRVEADASLMNAEKTAWQMQQTMQGYLQVTAPFSGVITQRNVSPGALVSAVDKGQPMLELKNVAHLRLQVDVPEGISSGLHTNDSIQFTTSAMPGIILKGAISRQSRDIQSQLRSERIEVDVPNADMKLSPGMYADVLLKTAGSTTAFAVPKTAVLTTTEGKYVFVSTGKYTYKKITITTGNQAADKIEVYGDLKEGDKVVSNPDDALVDEAE